MERRSNMSLRNSVQANIRKCGYFTSPILCGRFENAEFESQLSANG